MANRCKSGKLPANKLNHMRSSFASIGLLTLLVNQSQPPCYAMDQRQPTLAVAEPMVVIERSVQTDAPGDGIRVIDVPTETGTIRIIEMPAHIGGAATFIPQNFNNIIVDLRKRKLTLPLADADPNAMKGSFYQKRGTRMHEAVDLMAPRYTPIYAVEEGTIARLFLSQKGGLTIYEL